MRRDGEAYAEWLRQPINMLYKQQAPLEKEREKEKREIWGEGGKGEGRL